MYDLYFKIVMVNFILDSFKITIVLNYYNDVELLATWGSSIESRYKQYYNRYFKIKMNMKFIITIVISHNNSQYLAPWADITFFPISDKSIDLADMKPTSDPIVSRFDLRIMCLKY